MFASSVRLVIPKVLILAILGVYHARAFVPLNTRQSARISLPQRQLDRKWQPSPPSSSCSQPDFGQGLALFRRQQNVSSNRKHNPLLQLRKLLSFWCKALMRAKFQLRRAATILMASAMILMGSAGTYTPPASASSTSVMQKIMPSKSNDQIIDRYVKQHIFDEDDGSDPLEAAYREAHEDFRMTGAHPRALKEVTSEVLGQGAGNKFLKADNDDSGGVFSFISSGMRFLERRGLSETTALIVIASTLVVATPSMLLLFGMVAGTRSKRKMRKIMKSRYGDTYTVDASAKEEPDVEAPDDEDDDDDDVDDDDDDEDDKDGKK